MLLFLVTNHLAYRLVVAIVREVACELASRLGITDYSNKTEDEWLREFVATAPDTAREITDYDKFKREEIGRAHV